MSEIEEIKTIIQICKKDLNFFLMKIDVMTKNCIFDPALLNAFKRKFEKELKAIQKEIKIFSYLGKQTEEKKKQ